MTSRDFAVKLQNFHAVPTLCKELILGCFYSFLDCIFGFINCFKIM